VSLIGRGKDGHLAATNIGVMRDGLKFKCGVAINKVVDVFPFAKNTYEFILEADYVETFKLKLSAHGVSVEWLSETEALNPVFNQANTAVAPTVEETKQAARGYLRRMERRLESARGADFRQYIEAEMARARIQLESGVFAPRQPSATANASASFPAGGPLPETIQSREIAMDQQPSPMLVEGQQS
jgi:hypothetical protein